MAMKKRSDENSKYKIIAVDDEDGILDSLQVFLTKEGYTFVGVTSPVEAIEKIKQDTERDNYMFAEDALKYGLVDKVLNK